MKKLLIVLSIITLVLCMNKSMQEQEMIRFRILANSNLEEDQQLKKEILKVISKDLLKENKTMEEERAYLKENIPLFEQRIKEVTNKPFTINYGENYFPEKKNYKEGMYESLVITLGEGIGDNFWCILFPPICRIEDDENIEYKSFFKEALNKIKDIK